MASNLRLRAASFGRHEPHSSDEDEEQVETRRGIEPPQSHVRGGYREVRPCRHLHGCVS